MQPLSDQQDRPVGITGHLQEASDAHVEICLDSADCSDDLGFDRDGRSASGFPESEDKEADHDQAVAPRITEQRRAAGQI